MFIKSLWPHGDFVFQVFFYTCYVKLLLNVTRDEVLTKKVWERIQKIAVLNSFQLILKQNVETPFLRVPAPLHPWM